MDEWRFFLPISGGSDEPEAIRKGRVESRSDIYFPWSDSCGLKARGENKVEVKWQTCAHPVDDGAKFGNIERWKKANLPGHKFSKTTGFDDVNRLVESVKSMCGIELNADLIEIQVHCHKRRTIRFNPPGEVTLCVFTARRNGSSEPIITEYYVTESIEGVRDMHSAVQAFPLPLGAEVKGYPQLVCDIARRALAAST